EKLHAVGSGCGVVRGESVARCVDSPRYRVVRQRARGALAGARFGTRERAAGDSEHFVATIVATDPAYVKTFRQSLCADAVAAGGCADCARRNVRGSERTAADQRGL